LARFALGRDLLDHVQHGRGVEAEEVGDDDDCDPAEAQPAADAQAPSVFDVAAGSLIA
jgi:hypothetical protein